MCYTQFIGRKKIKIQVARDEAVSQTWHLPTQDVSTSLIIESKNIKKVKKDLVFVDVAEIMVKNLFFCYFLGEKKED